MPLTERAQAVLDELERLGTRPVDELTPEAARRQPGLGAAVERLLGRQERERAVEPMGAVDPIVLEHDGTSVPAVVYRPDVSAAVPIVVFLHGGGWVLDDHQSYDPVIRRIASGVPCAGVYVRYRLAPENPFPAAVDDAFTALQWAQSRGAEIGGDPGRVALAGQSAGGNLAAAVSLRARDEGIRLPASQLLVYPIADREAGRASYAEHEDAVGLSSRMMRWFWDKYVPEPQQRDAPLVSPLRAGDLSALEPTHVITAEVDPLRDEGREFARRLIEAGVDVRDEYFEGVMHGFFALVGVLPEADAACASAIARLREGFDAAA
jgi:acetyl esterase